MCEELNRRKMYCLFPREGAAPADQAFARMVQGFAGHLTERQVGPIVPGTQLALAAEFLTRLPGCLSVGDLQQVVDPLKGIGLLFSMPFQPFLESGIRAAAVRAGFEVEEQEEAK